MAKYIKCEAVLALIRPDDPNDERCAVTVATAKRLIRHALTTAPAADVAPVVHARWIPFHSETAGDIQYCSNCKIGNAAKSDFCPHCGAIMDGGDSDATD